MNVGSFSVEGVYNVFSTEQMAHAVFRIDYIVKEGASQPIKYTYSIRGDIPHSEVGGIGDINVMPAEREKIAAATTNRVFVSPQLHIWMKNNEYENNGLWDELSIPSNSRVDVWNLFTVHLGWLLSFKYVPFDCDQDPEMINIKFHIPTEHMAGVFTRLKEDFYRSVELVNTAVGLVERGDALVESVVPAAAQ